MSSNALTHKSTITFCYQGLNATVVLVVARNPWLFGMHCERALRNVDDLPCRFAVAHVLQYGVSPLSCHGFPEVLQHLMC